MGAMEDYGVVLEYLPVGKSTDMHREPVAQLVGETHFTLLEVVPKNASLTLGERIYIGKGERERIDHIKSRIAFEDLTSAAKSELKHALPKIVKQREEDFVGFFNKCGPVTIRQHQLELLPGVGKKHMRDIISQREKTPFESFEDISKRVPLLPDPVNILVDRIEQELRGSEKYYILTRPPYQKRER